MFINILKIISVLILFALFANSGICQTLNGTVYGKSSNETEPLNGAVVRWINTNIGITTNAEGKFELPAKNISDKRISVSFVGYQTDTIEIGEKQNIKVVLLSSLETEEITVEDEKKSTYFENLAPKTEVITENELKKDACCDLSGCFGRNSSVEVAVTDIITDSKEMKVLGLEGAYTQILIDNLPILDGLNVKYGLSSIPGTLINKIMVSKGSNSVIQGYGAISGIVNVLLKDRDNSDIFMVNAFVDNILEKQFNVNYGSKVKKWTTLASFHNVQKSLRVDNNGDGFLDNPLITRYLVYNKWKTGNDETEKTTLNIAAMYWNEERIGGQTNFNIGTDEGGSLVYGQTVKINSGDFYTRINHKFDRNNILKFFMSGVVYDQKSYFGTTRYDANQKSFYVNTFYEFPIATKNYLRIGVSYRHDIVKEIIELAEGSSKTYGGTYTKRESIPGIFVENSIDLFQKISIIGGVRYDYHNEYKSIVTPRLLVRYQPWKQTVIRSSIGTGFRIVNIWNEYPSMFASPRNILIPDALKPEKILNYGVDILQYFDGGFFSGSINLDFYRTHFSNKIIPDYDINPFKIYFLNLNGNAYSNIFQSELSLTFWNTTEIKLAYKYTDLYYYRDGVKQEQYFNSKHKLITNFSFSPRSKSYNYSFSVQWFGKQIMPSMAHLPPEYQIPSVSQSYAMVNTQFTKYYKHFEFYTGIENLLNFVQPKPIISADNPFGIHFDTMFMWGPVRGREFYIGARFLIRNEQAN